MTTKILTGTYSAGYRLKPAYSELYISASAVVGGVGVISRSPATIFNAGQVASAAGEAGVTGSGQGAGGNTGIDLFAGGQLSNVDRILAGAGGASAYNGSNQVTYAGGVGGGGVVLSAGGAVTNLASIGGGRGGRGGHGASQSTANPADGGAGFRQPML